MSLFGENWLYLAYRRKINLEINLSPEETASNLFQHREGQLMPALLLWSFAFCFLLSSHHQCAYKTKKQTPPAVTVVSKTLLTFSCAVLCPSPPAQLLIGFCAAPARRSHTEHARRAWGRAADRETCFQRQATKKAFAFPCSSVCALSKNKSIRMIF